MPYKGQQYGHPALGPNSLAPWGTRVGATLIDGAVFLGAFIVVAIIAGVLRAPALVILVFPAWLAYPIYMIGVRGATIGQAAVGTRTALAADGNQPSVGTAAIRLVAQMGISIVPFGSILDILWPLWDDRLQTLHDKVAGTVVVRTK